MTNYSGTLKMIELGDKPDFMGGNQWVFIHPKDPSLIVKVPHPNRIMTKRWQKDWRRDHKYLYLTRFFSEYVSFIARHPDEDDLIAPIHGFIKSKYGTGMIAGHIRDYDGKTSITLEDYAAQNGMSEELLRHLDILVERLKKCHVVMWDLRAVNVLVVRSQTGIKNMVVVDGLGQHNLLSLYGLLPKLNERKLHKSKEEMLKGLEVVCANAQSHS